MLTSLRRLFLRSGIFLVFYCLSLWSINSLLQSDQVSLNSKQYSLPNNQPFQYSSVLAALPVSRADIKTSFKVADARAEILRQYLEKYQSPLTPYADLIVQLADENDFDYRWLVAIAQQESNLCRHIIEGSYNCWGWGIYGDKVTKFKSYEDALRQIAPQFKQIFLGDLHSRDPHAVMEKYTPPSDGSWASGVKQFFGELQ